MLDVPDGSWALVTGASRGIGEALARSLARRRIPVILVARSAERLEALAGEIRRLHGVAAEALPLDLLAEGAAAALEAATEGAGRPVDLLVNNAGFGFYGPQVEQSLPRTLAMLGLNVVALVELTHRFASSMRRRGRGRILNVASTAGFLPVPYFATYAASKAFILSFSHALHEELAREGITVTALCPGTTRTEFHRVAGLRDGEKVGFPSLDPSEVAERGLLGLERGKPVVVPNLLDRLVIGSGRLVPRTWPPRIGAAIFSRLRRQTPLDP